MLKLLCRCLALLRALLERMEGEDARAVEKTEAENGGHVILKHGNLIF